MQIGLFEVPYTLFAATQKELKATLPVSIRSASLVRSNSERIESAAVPPVAVRAGHAATQKELKVVLAVVALAAASKLTQQLRKN